MLHDRWLAGQCPTFCQTRSTMVASGTWPSTWSPSTACCPRSASLRPSPVNQGTIVIRSGFYAVVLYCIYELDCFANLDRTSKSDTSFTVARGWTTSWSQSWGSMHEAWGLQSTRATPTMSSASRLPEWWLRSTGESHNLSSNLLSSNGGYHIEIINWHSLKDILRACPVPGVNQQLILFLGLWESA